MNVITSRQAVKILQRHVDSGAIKRRVLREPYYASDSSLFLRVEYSFCHLWGVLEDVGAGYLAEASVGFVDDNGTIGDAEASLRAFSREKGEVSVRVKMPDNTTPHLKGAALPREVTNLAVGLVPWATEGGVVAGSNGVARIIVASRQSAVWRSE